MKFSIPSNSAASSIIAQYVGEDNNLEHVPSIASIVRSILAEMNPKEILSLYLNTVDIP